MQWLRLVVAFSFVVIFGCVYGETLTLVREYNAKLEIMALGRGLETPGETQATAPHLRRVTNFVTTNQFCVRR